MWYVIAFGAICGILWWCIEAFIKSLPTYYQILYLRMRIVKGRKSRSPMIFEAKDGSQWELKEVLK